MSESGAHGNMTRRDCLHSAAGAVLAAAAAPALKAADSQSSRLKVAMCDWSMGRIDPSAFALGREIGLDGVEVSIGFPDNNLWLRQSEKQKEYLAAARDAGLAIPSMAMGVLNHVPLMSEPVAAVWVADTIEAAKALGARSILLAFFGKGELRGNNDEDMRRVIDALKELAPRAEKAGVVLGLETYLSAEDHLRIIDAVKSPALQVYYDVYNADHAGHDPVREIRLLGRRLIRQVHVKEGPAMLGSGRIDWPAVAGALREIGYDGWIVLETQSPSKDVLADTRKNLAYVREHFGPRS